MDNSNNKRIIKNTFMLYLRQILVLGVSLFTVRIVLNVLGVQDYGVYTVIGGVIYLFSFLGSSMASATQRFFSYALGEKDFQKLSRIFTVNLVIYICIAVIAVVLLESVGNWFINNHLKLPPGRIEAAQWIFHFSIFTFVFIVLTIPITSIIIAHEDMHIYAYMSIIETLLKLGAVLMLVYIDFDKLKLYCVLLFLVSVINFLVYIFIAVRKYEECQFRKFYWDKAIFREVVGFTGWTLFGQLTSVGRNEAITILINQYFNPVIVAARGIAFNIASQVNLFSNNFNTGLYPPLIKSYASGNHREMFDLIFNGSKITFFLMWVIGLPFFLEMDTVLNLWLKNPPEYAVLFTRLSLLESLVLSVSLPIATAARAPGRMKVYELTLGSLQIMIFIASWFILKLGGSAASIFIVAIVVNVIMLFVRLIIVRGIIGLPLRPFFLKVLLPVIIVGVVSAGSSYTIKSLLPLGLIFSFINIFCSVVFASLSMYFIGLNREMRLKFQEMFKNKILRKIKFMSV